MAPLKPQLRVRFKRRVQELGRISATTQGYAIRQLGRYYERLVIEDAKHCLGDEFVHNFLENERETNDTAA